jgi:hypothetical protein
MDFEREYVAFYDECLSELKSRDDFSDAYIPMLRRFVFITIQANKLGADIAQEEVTVSHTNKVGATNQATSPKWRMYLLLGKESSALARELRLSPVNAPAGSRKREKKGFDTGMKVNKSA